MSERNPYENETVDIPTFSTKDESEEIDRSLFKMAEADDEEEYEDDEEYEEYEPSYHKVKKPVFVIMIVLLVVSIALAVFGLIFGFSNKSKYNTLKSEYDAYVTTAEQTQSELNAKITELEAAETKKEEEAASATATTYTVVVDSVNVRSGAGSSNSKVALSSLPSDIAKLCGANADGLAYVVSGTEIPVTETTTSGSQTWGKIADNAWVCLKDGSTDYCTAK